MPAKPKPTARVRALVALGFKASSATRLHDRMLTVERSKSVHAVDAVLNDIVRAMQASGVEAITGKHPTRPGENVVGLYVIRAWDHHKTVVYDAVVDKFIVTSMSNFIEKNSRSYEID